MKIKICGIRSIESAEAATNAGADFIGFNFVPTSKRRIDPRHAAEIIAQLSASRSKKVGVFKNQSIDEIRSVLAIVPLDYLQLHGMESPEICATMPLPVIKTFAVESTFDSNALRKEMRTYVSVDLFMLDRCKQGAGERLQIESIAELAKDTRIFAAGGITSETIEEYKNIPQLYAVDVAGGVETDGHEDIKKIKRLVELAKR